MTLPTPLLPITLDEVRAGADAELTVTEGVVYLVLEDDERALTPGDRATVPAGAAHRLWNAGDGPAAFALAVRTRAEGPPLGGPSSLGAVSRAA